MHRAKIQAPGLQKPGVSYSTPEHVSRKPGPGETGSVSRFNRRTLEQTFTALRPTSARLALEVQNLLTIRPKDEALDVDWDLEQVAGVIQQLTWRELPSKQDYPQHRALMESWLKLGRHLMQQK